MKVLLISTYELGRQPVHLASPAAALQREGHDVTTVDVAISQIDEGLIASTEAVAISVPMHTATRLAGALVRQVRSLRPELPIALYGLYALVGDAEVDARFAGEYEPALSTWVNNGSDAAIVSTGRSEFALPDRRGLASLDSYARLELGGETKLAGAVEASHGCRHRCRHCPLPTVYDGRIRIVPASVVVDDISNLVAAGAGHITFGDPDFLNAPVHSLAVLEEAHSRHPELTFDVTVKVSHILEHRDLWPRLASLNLLFVISAFETTDDETLDVLAKQHTRDDMIEALALLRASGIHVRPTWLPFMPWTTPDDVADIFGFIADHDLASATDPVQMAIKLLVPPGSLLLDHPSMAEYVGDYDAGALVYKWGFADPSTEVLWKELETIASDASECGAETVATLNQMRQVVQGRSGHELEPFRASVSPVPRLTESWFCCAEPTQQQAIGLSIRRG